MLRIFRGSVFSIHPGGLSFRYTQGVCVFSIHTGGLSLLGVCIFDTPVGSEIFGGSVFSILPGGLRFLGGLWFRYTQGI